uniref:ATP-dependent Clp protease proteolytic subunit n=1 Tax=Erodium gruinum TaxID=337380 RepID=A0A0A0PFW5_9ROSI|nr:clp protease proteolytic subunit [Erodium gruinum]AHH80611.1 clp protease proteolytic subunit [Erodium gruinum]
MPFGVPKVVFEASEEEEATWVDLYNRVYRERALFLGREINTELANNLISLMVFLTIDRPGWEPIMLINSPGGFVFSGLAIYDTMRSVGVSTICLGLAASMASVALLGGNFTKRAAFPHARVMIHQPRMKSFEDTLGRVVKEALVLLDLRESVTDIYAHRTGQSWWVLTVDLESDTYMTPKEAKAYGIIDQIIAEK